MAKQRQSDIHALEITHHNTMNNTNRYDSPKAPMIIADSPTTTDQYHHSETIWRVFMDITSLIICKNDIFFFKEIFF